MSRSSLSQTFTYCFLICANDWAWSQRFAGYECDGWGDLRTGDAPHVIEAFDYDVNIFRCRLITVCKRELLKMKDPTWWSLITGDGRQFLNSWVVIQAVILPGLILFIDKSFILSTDDQWIHFYNIVKQKSILFSRIMEQLC